MTNDPPNRTRLEQAADNSWRVLRADLLGRYARARRRTDVMDLLDAQRRALDAPPPEDNPA